MIKIFIGGGGGGGLVDGEGVAVKDAWSGVVEVIKGSLQNILKQGVGKRQTLFVARGRGFEGVTTPAPGTV